MKAVSRNFKVGAQITDLSELGTLALAKRSVIVGYGYGDHSRHEIKPASWVCSWQFNMVLRAKFYYPEEMTEAEKLESAPIFDEQVKKRKEYRDYAKSIGFYYGNRSQKKPFSANISRSNLILDQNPSPSEWLGNGSYNIADVDFEEIENSPTPNVEFIVEHNTPEIMAKNLLSQLRDKFGK